ncbi:MAG: M56 family metallopeptidase [Deltaproteobacteria bacterium]
MNAFAALSQAGFPDHAFCTRLTIALAHLVWQGLAIGALSLAAGRLLRRRSANLRYALDVAALVLLALCLPATYCLVESPASADGEIGRHSAAAGLAETDIMSIGPIHVTNEAVTGGDVMPAEELRRPRAESPAISAAPTGSPAGTEGTAPHANVTWQRFMEPAAPYATGLYFLGVLAMSLRLMLGLWGGHRLRRSATPVEDQTLLEAVRRQAQQIGLRFVPVVAWCRRVSTPIVVGIVTPAILLPASLGGGLTPQQLSALLVHELAHIRRFDLFVNLLQRVVETLLFFHPAVWYLSRQISRERENCCDDCVLAAGWRGTEYADALLRMAELCFTGRPEAANLAALGAAGERPSEFKRRVLRLLGVEAASPLRLSRLGIAVFGCILMLVVAGPALTFPHGIRNPETMRAALADTSADHVRTQLEIIDRELAVTETGKGTQTRAVGDATAEGTAADTGPLRVALKLDRAEFLLGESIAVEYEMTNTGTQPMPYGRGAYFPDLRWNDGFRLSAVRIDDKGKAIGKPVANWRAPESHGGPTGRWMLDPGKHCSETLFVTRVVRFMEPGRYRLRIENVGRDDQTVFCAGETILTLKAPTAEQARVVYEAMKHAPRKAYDDNAMKFLGDVADFETMHQPVYLPILREFALKGDVDALPSLERMESLEANEVLVAALARALDSDDVEVARACYRHLQPSLPFPNWYDDVNRDYDKPRRERSDRTWKPEFVPTLVRLARRLIPEVKFQNRTLGDKPGQLHKSAQPLLGEIDYIYRCVGRPDDFVDCMMAYALSIEMTKTLPLETHQYFRPRGSAFGFGHTVIRMMQRGAHPPIFLNHPGEAATFAIALRTQNNFRPEGWQAQVMKWLRAGPPYLAEVILDHLPEPIPDEVLDWLPAALASDYIDLAIAGCKIAEKHPRAAYKAPLQKLLATATEEYLVKFSRAAAKANGLIVPGNDSE